MRIEGKQKQVSYCSACGEEKRHSSILICADCLNDECKKFSSLFERSEISEEEDENGEFDAEPTTFET